jgi:molecular chaperone DnaK (HSP70)
MGDLSLTDQRKLIVGIDFGTTFSGVAWAETRRVCIPLPWLRSKD